jgi:23S rRNA pseudouridine1911/1915/1917 synthase
VALNRGWSYREQAGPDASGRSVVAYLAATRLLSTEQEWAARIDRGEVEVNGSPATRATVLESGHIITWHRPPWDEPAVPTHFDVLHEDDALVAINKPSGLPTMPAGGFLEHTLLSLVRGRYPDASPLHRLGRFTSGVVLFARTRDAASQLARSWRDRDVKKAYRTLAVGIAHENVLTIDAPIGPVSHPRLGTVHAASPSGKPSHSIATVLERRDQRTLFSVEITTGRPHQIRIHMAVIGHPLAGDPVYASGGGLLPNPGLPGDGGYLLHAERLQFAQPITGERMIVTARPPQELRTREELAA